MPLKATLDDVARTAGVHRSTVSLSLRDHPRIPVQTRERVKAVARQLGYRIDPLVAALMQLRRTPHPRPGIPLAFLGAKAPSGSREGNPIDYFTGAAAHARESGFALRRFHWEELGAVGAALPDQLSRRGIKGVIIDSGSQPEAEQACDLSRFSCVSLTPLAFSSLHRVTENLFDAVAEALQCCVARGYERIGLVQAATEGAPWRADRILGAYTMQQLRRTRETALPACPGRPSTFPVFRRWFCEHTPAALLTDDPVRVQGWLHRLGCSVPADVGLVAVQIGPELPCSGFCFDPTVTGTLAVDTLIDLIRRHETGTPAVPHEILVGTAWHEAGTLPPRDTAPTPFTPPTNGLR